MRRIFNFEMKKALIFSVLACLVILSCRRVEVAKSSDNESVKDSLVQEANSDYLLMSTVWFQASAEMRAIYFQTYQLAEDILRKNIELKSTEKKPAVVVDIDETVLDNASFEANRVLSNCDFTPDGWKEWTEMKVAEALPGSVDFLNKASQMGCDVFYISNRKIHEQEATMENLRTLGFPCIEDKFFLFKDSVSSKESRRNIAEETHEIVLLIGDNLSDFSSIYEISDQGLRSAKVDSTRSDFGRKFLILPNPMYGDWEKVIFENNRDLTLAQKIEKLKGAIRGY